MRLSELKVGARFVLAKLGRVAAQRFIDQRNAKQTQDAKVLHDQEMIELKAPEVWDRLSEEFARKCTEFNSEPGVGNTLSLNRTEDRTLTIRRADTDAKLTITFLPFYIVRVCGVTGPAEFKFEVIAGTSEVGLTCPRFVYQS